MKKKMIGLCLLACMGLGSVSVIAQEQSVVPISALLPDENSEDMVSIHQINMNVPITRAEFITVIIQTLEGTLPPIMDTHYAMPAMEKAEELGIIDLKDYPMETWSEIMPNAEKNEVLTKAMASDTIDIGKVYTALSQVLVDTVKVDGKPVDFKGLPVAHSNGKLMLPVRAVAEAMGFEVTWDAATYTATLNNEKIKSNVQVGFDSYNYSSVQAIGMSAPFTAGAAPRLIDGTLYAPYDYFLMFADGEINGE